jgi:hypothetical protein
MDEARQSHLRARFRGQFEHPNTWNILGGWFAGYATAFRATKAAQDGQYGLEDCNGSD